MKKLLATIVVVVLSALLGACASSGYKYAADWNVTTGSTVDATAYIQKYAKEAPKEYHEVLNNVKDLVKKNAPYQGLLNWGKFNKLNKVLKSTPPTEAISGMEYEEIYVFKSYYAFYENTEDAIYLLPQFSVADSDTMLYVLLHEISHSLVSNWEDQDDNILVEGLVDSIAYETATKAGYEATPKYQEAILCIRMLMDIYGEEEVVKAICEDKIVELIDNSTEPGMAEKLNLALNICHVGPTADDVLNATNVELEILAHAAKDQGVDIDKWFDALAAIYEANGIKLKIEYFKRI